MNFPVINQELLESTSASFRKEVLEDLDAYISPKTFQELKDAAPTYIRTKNGKVVRTESNTANAKAGDILFRISNNNKEEISRIKKDIVMSPHKFCGHFFLVFTFGDDDELKIRTTSNGSVDTIKFSSLNRDHLFILPRHLHYLLKLADNPFLLSHVTSVKPIEPIPSDPL